MAAAESRGVLLALQSLKTGENNRQFSEERRRSRTEQRGAWISRQPLQPGQPQRAPWTDP